MNHHEKFTKIEQYLDGSMSQEEKSNFETQLANNAELAKELTLQKEVESLLAHSEEDELRLNLGKLDKQYSKADKG